MTDNNQPFVGMDLLKQSLIDLLSSYQTRIGIKLRKIEVVVENVNEASMSNPAVSAFVMLRLKLRYHPMAKNDKGEYVSIITNQSQVLEYLATGLDNNTLSEIGIANIEYVTEHRGNSNYKLDLLTELDDLSDLAITLNGEDIKDALNM